MNKNIIAYGITSPLHLINFLSYLNSSKTKFDNIYIHIHNYWGRTTVPERYIEYCISKGYKIIYDKNVILDNLQESLSSHDELTIVFVKSPSVVILSKALLYDNIKSLIIIDEGISSYANYSHSLKASFREKGIVGIIKGLTKTSLLTPLKFLNTSKLYSYTAFAKIDQSVNQDYAINFRKTLQSLKLFNSYESKDYSRSFLFCSQPWVELGLMDPEQYNNLLLNLSKFVKAKGMSLVIKKHPVDRVFNYEKFDVINFDGAIEELVWTQNFYGMISICSTSSILISACLGLDSYLLDFKELDKFDVNVKKLFKKYCLDLSLS